MFFSYLSEWLRGVCQFQALLRLTVVSQQAPTANPPTEADFSHQPQPALSAKQHSRHMESKFNMI